MRKAELSRAEPVVELKLLPTLRSRLLRWGRTLPCRRRSMP